MSSKSRENTGIIQRLRGRKGFWLVGGTLALLIGLMLVGVLVRTGMIDAAQGSSLIGRWRHDMDGQVVEFVLEGNEYIGRYIEPGHLRTDGFKPGEIGFYHTKVDAHRYSGTVLFKWLNGSGQKWCPNQMTVSGERISESGTTPTGAQYESVTWTRVK